MKEFDSYKKKMIQANKEAKYTIITSLVIFVYFWSCIIIFKDSLDLFIFYMPLWFVLSVIGGYILSCIAVILLVKKLLKNFDL